MLRPSDVKELLVSLLELEKFQEWLNGKSPDSVVGASHHCSGCPLARYLKDGHSKEVSVGYGLLVTVGIVEGRFSLYVNDLKYEGLYPFPAWAYHFRKMVDDRHPSLEKVTASDALKILKAAVEKGDDDEYKSATSRWSH